MKASSVNSSVTVYTPAAYLQTRDEHRAVFLSAHLSGAGQPELIGEDWGSRRYFRVGAGGKTYILMESVPDHLPFSAPGHKIADFIRISEALNKGGLHAPAVIAAQPEEGYVLLEDMGDTSFYASIQHGGDEKALYGLAVDVLTQMQRAFPVNDLNLPSYHSTYVHTARRRIIDWYRPTLLGVRNEDGVAEEYLRLWDEIEGMLPPTPNGFMHVDYHAQNLMWLPQEQGLRRCGILDFQGAMWGPLPYDLANLLEDIRRDVPDDVRAAMIERRVAGMVPSDKEAFMAWYKVMALQFHCRIIGQIIRLAVVLGKPQHLRNMERVQGFIAREIEDPIMLPLKSFFTAQGIRFDRPVTVDVEQVKRWVRSDAF